MCWCWCGCCRQRVRAEENTPDVHTVPDTGARERISFQPIPDSPSSHRDRAHSAPHRASNQDLVSEQTDEVEEGE